MTDNTYNEDTVTELMLYAENDSGIYHSRAEPIMAMLVRKMRKGVNTTARGAYRSDRADKAWLYWADDAARKYTREFDTPQRGRPYGCFTVADRKEAARRMARQFEDEIAAGNWTNTFGEVAYV